MRMMGGQGVILLLAGFACISAQTPPTPTPPPTMYPTIAPRTVNFTSALPIMVLDNGGVPIPSGDVSNCIPPGPKPSACAAKTNEADCDSLKTAGGSCTWDPVRCPDKP
jgi:hypothetical protein